MNVNTQLTGRRVTHISCPNEELSKAQGTVQGTFIEDGKLYLIVLFDNRKAYIINSNYVTFGTD